MVGVEKRLRWVSALVAAGLALAGCGRPPASDGTAAPTTPATGPAGSAAAPVATTTAVAPATTTTASLAAGPAVVVSRGATTRRMVALTFDAGSDAGFAGQILDTLAASGVTATFGLTGQWAEANPDLVVRMVAGRHQLVNHTWDHRSFTGVSAKPAVAGASERRDQLDRTDAVLTRLSGRSSKPWFRPPYGDYDSSVNADVGALGYRYNVLWSLDSLGWQGLSPGAIASRCLNGAEPGAIYLFHVGSQSQDAAALPAVIAGLRDGGYTFGTVADVIAG